MNRFATLRRLVEPGQPSPDSVFETLCKSLQDSGEHARVQFQIVGGEQRRFWRLELADKFCKVVNGPTERPDLEIITRAENMQKMADGSLSPIEAFARGKMRIRGNLELAKRLFKKLAAPGGITDVC